jgi:hypothetical protein
MGAQIEALHGIGILAPIYVSVMWDDLAGEAEPGWVIVRRDGSLMMRPPLSDESPLTGGWTTLEVSTGYGDYLVAQTEEICARYDVDGFFFDICFPVPNYSPWGQARMHKAGVSPDDLHAALRFAEEKLHGFLQRLGEAVRARGRATRLRSGGWLRADSAAAGRGARLGRSGVEKGGPDRVRR